MDEEDAASLLSSEDFKKFQNVKVIGLMGMATFTNDKKQIFEEFQKLKKIYNDFKAERPHFKVLSMGMSGDYKIAIANESNMIRVGSAIFGERNYN